MLELFYLDTCYSAAYMSQTRDQQRFTISEVAADWHEPMVPQRIMWPSFMCLFCELLLWRILQRLFSSLC